MDALQQLLGHQFNDPALLQEALSHPSVTSEGEANYERLEFLGDAVLGLVISEQLLQQFPDEPEGALARRRSGVVKGSVIAQVAKEVSLMEHLRGNHLLTAEKEQNNALENAMEAVIGALYLDAGLDSARSFILRYWLPKIEQNPTPPSDPKTTLQEWSQSKGLGLPHYQEVEREGPDHAPEFVVEVTVKNQLPVRAKGTSKKIAERKAAQKMLETLQ